MIERTAIILAGGESRRFGCDKGLVRLAGKPLILHVIDRVRGVVDEVVICLKSGSQKSTYLQVLPEDVKVAVDSEKLPQCPLTGAFTGLMNAGGRYSALLPCDAPFVSTKLVDLLFEIVIGVDAVIPRWPNDYIEPLQAVYKTDVSLEAARRALMSGRCELRAMISLLRRVRYVSTLVIEEIDPKMYTFMNINTPLDLKKAEVILKRNPVT